MKMLSACLPYGDQTFRKEDVPALSVFAGQLASALRNARLFQAENRRARALAILLEASEATSSSLDLDTILTTLASQLLEISGFQSCCISEWDKETDRIFGRVEYSKTHWSREKADFYSLSDYPRSKQVLLTGNPIILQGDFEAEEKTWMTELGRTAVVILALKAQERVIGLVELATTKNDKLFDPQVLVDCQEILVNAATWLNDPLSANDPKKLYEIEDALREAAWAEICSFSEWEQARNRIFTVVVSSSMSWASGEGVSFEPWEDTAWKLALYEGKTSVLVRQEGNESIAIGYDSSARMEVEILSDVPFAERGRAHRSG